MKKIKYGGTYINKYNQLQLFLSILIIGYFGIKIIYGLFFNFYPLKYYNKNIQITSNEDNSNEVTDNITLNSFVPGLWNNEMTDFITMIVISFIIFIFTNASNKMIINENGNINIEFICGYIIGLGYPPMYSNYINYYKNDIENSIVKYISLAVTLFIIICILIININSSSKLGLIYRNNYIIYIVSFSLLFFGLLFTRKISKNYSVVSYFNNNGDNCTFKKNGIIRSSGEIINISVPFISLLIILLFVYDPIEILTKYIYIFIYGILLGIIVSGISYFGMEYFLQKQPEKECNTLKECSVKEIPDNYIETENDDNNELPKIDLNLKDDVNNIFNFKGISIINVVLIIFIILLAIYLVYYYITNNNNGNSTKIMD